MASIVVTKVVDLIPVGGSAETAQNSEPSLAVNPADPTQIVAGAFGPLTTNDTPIYLSTDGGTGTIVRRSADWALEQVSYRVLQDPVGRQPDRIAHALGFEELYISGLAKAASPRK